MQEMRWLRISMEAWQDGEAMKHDGAYAVMHTTPNGRYAVLVLQFLQGLGSDGYGAQIGIWRDVPIVNE